MSAVAALRLTTSAAAGCPRGRAASSSMASSSSSSSSSSSPSLAASIRGHSSLASRVSRVTNGTRCTAFFKFNNPLRENAETAGIYGAAGGRDDFCANDVNFYFEYMGMLAAEGNYDRLEKMKSAGLDAVDLLLLMAAGENDAPKVAEMLRAGADTTVKDIDGKTAEELATNEQVLELLRDPAKAKAF